MKQAGFFSWNEQAFVFDNGAWSCRMEWDKIVRIEMWKEDLLIYDELCMDVWDEEGQKFSTGEGAFGWIDFLQQIKKALPAVPADFDIKMMTTPAFEESRTVIFAKGEK